MPAALQVGLTLDGAVELSHSLGDVRVLFEKGGSGLLSLTKRMNLQ